MEKLTKFFINNYRLTIIITILMVVSGIMGYSSLNNESFPSVNFATATIVTEYRGATPEDVEAKITKPIEDQIKTVSGLKDVMSISQSGLSKIVVVVDMDNEVVSEVMEDLEKALDRVNDLPLDLQEDPKFTELDSEEFPAIEFALSGPNTNRLRDRFADKIKEELEDINSVSAVRLVGFTKREFGIYLDQKKLANYHISVNEVMSQIRSRNINTPGGKVKNDQFQKLIRVEGKVTSTKDLESIPVRSNFSGSTVYLKDIATIVDGHEDERVLSKVNGKPATLLIVNKKAGSDTIKLVEDIDKKILNLNKIMPKELTLSSYHNEAVKVKNKLEILESNAISGLFLVIFFLFIFLPGRAGIMASLSLPLAILGIVAFMGPLGTNLNAITILALVIALGMLVDNSVVISENYARLRSEGLDKNEAALSSVRSLWLPITGTAMTTIAAFMPMLVTKGVMGEFIRYIPIIVCLSLVISLFESFFLLPMRLVKSDKDQDQSITVNSNDKVSKGNKTPNWFVKLSENFERFMVQCVRHRYIALLCFLSVLTFSLYMMFGVNKFILFPAEQTEIYISRFELPSGTPLEKTYSASEQLEVDIKETLGDKVKNIVTRIGVSSMGPTDPKDKSGTNIGIVLIYVTDETALSADNNKILKDLRTISKDGFSELSFEEMVNGPPIGEPVNVTLRSNSDLMLNDLSSELVSKLEKVDGLFDVKLDDVYGDNEIFVKINYPLAARLGLDAQKIGQTIKSVMDAAFLSDIVLDNKKIDLKLRFQDSDRSNLEKLENVQILDNKGNLVPLGKIATFEEFKGSRQIKRFDFKRSKTLTSNLDQAIITSNEANALVQKYFTELQKTYPDVSLVFGGEQENTKESMESLAKALVIALMIIFAILVFLFNSFLRPVIIMSTIPLGLVGTSIAFYFHDKAISFLAMIGLIGLAGIIVNSGIVLISFIDDLRKETDLSLDEILVKASGMRLRAVIVTSLTTISGLIPTAYGIGGTDALLVPMTLAMAWGLTSGTILTLVWVPCAYKILEDFESFSQIVFNSLANVLSFKKKSNEVSSNGI